MQTTTITAQRFIPVQLATGQWRVLDTKTGEQRGQAVRYAHEAQRRAANLERIYS